MLSARFEFCDRRPEGRVPDGAYVQLCDAEYHSTRYGVDCYEVYAIARPCVPRGWRMFYCGSVHGFSSQDAVAWLLDRLRSVGIRQAIAVDLTKPEFDVPVVRIVVPGLEGIDGPDYVPGRRAAAMLAEAP